MGAITEASEHVSFESIVIDGWDEDPFDVSSNGMQFPNGAERTGDLEEQNQAGAKGAWRNEIVPDSVFIVFSGFSEFTYAKDALSLGVIEYLEKPITPREVRDLVSRVASVPETSP